MGLEGAEGSVELESVSECKAMELLGLVVVEGEVDTPPIWDCEEVSGKDTPRRDVI